MFNRTLFSIGLTTLQLEGIDNEILCQYVIDNINKNSRHVNQSDQELNLLNEVVLSETQKILDSIISNSEITNIKTNIKRVWVNHNLNEDISTTHAHRDSFLSAVYYPKSTDGKIQFYIPYSEAFLSHVPIHQAKQYHEYNSTYWKFEVKTGWLLIFNSMLPHVALKSTDERISIVYDIGVIENE